MVCCNHNASKQPGPSACSHQGPFALPTLIAMLLALLAGSAEPAGAATAQIGAVEEIRAAAPPAAITEGGFAVQASQSSGTYAVPPGYETITSWSHSAGTAAGSLTFKVYRPTGVLNEYTTVAFDTRVVSAGSVQTFPVRIAVQAGDRLGLSSDAVQLAYETFDTGDRIGFFGSDLTVGSVGATIGEPFPEFKLDVAATLNTADINELPPAPTVPPPPPGYGPPRPTLAVLRITPSAFAAARSGPSVRPSGRTTPATLVSFTVSIASKVRFTVARLVTGRKRGSGKNVRCVATTRANRSAASCKREATVRGSFTRTARPGRNNFRFSGRIGGRRLARGSYRLIAVATANGVSSEKSRRAFRIVR
jgi:hypothetical protein